MVDLMCCWLCLVEYICIVEGCDVLCGVVLLWCVFDMGWIMDCLLVEGIVFECLFDVCVLGVVED